MSGAGDETLHLTPLSSVHTVDSTAHLLTRACMGCASCCLQMTTSQVEAWSTDANQVMVGEGVWEGCGAAQGRLTDQALVQMCPSCAMEVFGPHSTMNPWLSSSYTSMISSKSLITEMQGLDPPPITPPFACSTLPMMRTPSSQHACRQSCCWTNCTRCVAGCVGEV